MPISMRFTTWAAFPWRCSIDNMKHVVISHKGRQTVFNVEFTHFANHYAFKPVACPPYSPWVKGKVERPVDYIREAFCGAIPLPPSNRPTGIFSNG